MNSQPVRWSITVLTIPQREAYLKRLMESLNELALTGPTEIVVVYNARPEEPRHDLEMRIRSFSRELPVSVYFNHRDPSIVSGRNLQLGLCKAPLICFVDDDLTVHGDVFPLLEETLSTRPLSLVGLPSFEGEKPFKPRATSPSVDYRGVRYMSVQGMLAAGYRDLLLDQGGFNQHRRFWGEWTELNLRLWRSGFPTGYRLDGGFLRHYPDAPESPTRNREGRELDVVWGLMCTALEYDAVDVNAATETFWQLVEERYLAYSFGDQLSHKTVLSTVLTLMPKLSEAWPDLMRAKAISSGHRFHFKPFHPIEKIDVLEVLYHAKRAVVPYRDAAFKSGSKGRPRIPRRPFWQRVLGMGRVRG